MPPFYLVVVLSNQLQSHLRGLLDVIFTVYLVFRAVFLSNAILLVEVVLNDDLAHHLLNAI